MENKEADMVFLPILLLLLAAAAADKLDGLLIPAAGLALIGGFLFLLTKDPRVTVVLVQAAIDAVPAIPIMGLAWVIYRFLERRSS